MLVPIERLRDGRGEVGDTLGSAIDGPESTTPLSVNRGQDTMTDSRVRALMEAIRMRPTFMSKKLELMKIAGPKRAGAPDFVWRALLTSHSTWGGIRGADDFEKNYQLVRYENLIGLASAPQRKNALKDAFWHKWGHYREMKLRCACSNFQKVLALGGGPAASNQARRCRGLKEKKAFMMQFDGVGEKYGRDIWMDVYDSDFRDSIAVDQRVKNVLKALGLDRKLRSYVQREGFLREVALNAGVEPWELDRLLFNFGPFFIWAIESAD